MSQSSNQSLQEVFAVSDDVVEMISEETDAPLRVKVDGAALGVLLELLLLKRAAKTAISISDGSARGNLFRELLASGESFRCKDGLGVSGRARHLAWRAWLNDRCLAHG